MNFVNYLRTSILKSTLPTAGSKTPAQRLIFYKVKSSHLKCSVKKVFLEILQDLKESTCARVYFLIKLQAFIKKETLAQVYSCEFCKISKNTFSYRTPPSDCFYKVASLTAWRPLTVLKRDSSPGIFL